jgi:spermidine synthase
MSTLLSKAIETPAPSARLTKSAVAMPFYEISIFLGAFLLFSVQLILGKYLLPWYGGTPALWTTCMFFFQALLLAGYAYAHTIVKCFNARAQSVIHVFLLSAGSLWLAVMGLRWHGFLLPGNTWRPEGNHPVSSLIFLLFVAIAFPYFMLSSTGPLLQSWFTRTHPARSPYRLYALSNLASLLALLSYPVAVEPSLSLRLQAGIWSAAFLTYAMACAFCAWKTASARPLSRYAEDRIFQDASGPAANQSLFWMGLAACSCVMFLSTTNQICQNVAVVPFLWILPLSVYLLSFIICFDQPRWYSRSIFLPAFAVSVFLGCFLLNGWTGGKIILQIAAYLFVLFACCMMCHGELARSKPASRYLTSFYLMVSLGGTVGGAFAALVAPKIFPAFWEYQLGLWGSVLFVLLALVRDKSSWLYSSRFGLPVLAILAAVLPGVTAIVNHKGSSSSLWPAVPVFIAAYVITKLGEREPTRARAHAVPIYGITALSVLGALLFFSARGQIQGSRMVSRNFYGVLTVMELNSQYSDWRAFTLLHGGTAHGFQFQTEDKRALPTGYYGTTSGAGRTITALQKRHSQWRNPEPLRVGVVGLGVGTLAAYGRPGDYFRFYEINPEVIHIADNEAIFTYLKNCRAKLEVITGDARISMESELRRNHPQFFDVLVIDAFTGDAIPIHLLTKEVFEIYLHEIKSDGVIALHITNAHLDLRPLMLKIAEHFRLHYAFLHSQGDGMITTHSDWVLLSHDQTAMDLIATPAEQNTAEQQTSKVRLWTDQYSNLFSVARW